MAILLYTNVLTCTALAPSYYGGTKGGQVNEHDFLHNQMYKGDEDYDTYYRVIR
jgi:hypothetical protein